MAINQWLMGWYKIVKNVLIKKIKKHLTDML